MNREELDILLRDSVQQSIAQNRGRDHLSVALDARIDSARLVASQIKYLKRAESKLPTYAAAQCIIAPRAFEQASSEAAANAKTISGDSLLDLTCGLGVDSLNFSRHFRRVVALERDPILAEITAENMRRMGAMNVEVVNCSAEEYLGRSDEHFDWIYADPDRRSESGKKLVRLEDCSPNIVELMPQIQQLAGRFCLKNSPLFDVDMARQLFPDSCVEVISLGDECKEVLVYSGEGIEPRLSATAVGVGSFSVSVSQRIEPTPPPKFRAERYRWLIVPDVALLKARLAREHLAQSADIWSDTGYGFAEERPMEGILGRVLEIEKIDKYEPKELKKRLRGVAVELLKRDFPISVDELTKRLGVRAGAQRRVAFTKIGSDFWVIHLK